MKKALIFLVIFFILLAAIVFVLNFLGIIPVGELVNDLLARVPFITTFQELREENDLLQLKVEVLEYELQQVLTAKGNLQTQMDYRDMELSRKIREISFLEERINELDRALTFREERLDHLIAIYREMKPEDVASILINLEDIMIIQILGRLRARDAAAILTYFPSQRAAVISRNIFQEEGR